MQSLCNHSCEPNAEVAYGPPENNFTLHLVALKEIAAGEEIEISYLDEELLRKSRNFRRKELRYEGERRQRETERQRH